MLLSVYWVLISVVIFCSFFPFSSILPKVARGLHLLLWKVDVVIAQRYQTHLNLYLVTMSPHQSMDMVRKVINYMWISFLIIHQLTDVSMVSDQVPILVGNKMNQLAGMEIHLVLRINIRSGS